MTTSDAGTAAREFSINMRGLRNNWLLGGLFGGGEAAEAATALQLREIDIQKAELMRQEALLRQKEQEMNVRD
jgi:hypothetical protein